MKSLYRIGIRFTGFGSPYIGNGAEKPVTNMGLSKERNLLFNYLVPFNR